MRPTSASDTHNARIVAKRAAADAQESQDEAARVFRKAPPAVALVSDAEGFGSGVVVGAKGYILTNYHVVNTPCRWRLRWRWNEMGRSSRWSSRKSPR